MAGVLLGDVLERQEQDAVIGDWDLACVWLPLLPFAATPTIFLLHLFSKIKKEEAADE